MKKKHPPSVASKNPKIFSRMNTRRSSLYVENAEKTVPFKTTNRRASNFKYELNNFTSTTSFNNGSGASAGKLPKLKSRNMERSDTQKESKAKKLNKKFQTLKRGFSSGDVLFKSQKFRGGNQEISDKMSKKRVNGKLFLPV